MMERVVEAKTRTRFTRPLLQWYQAAGRDLPWRKNTDPYTVWVSEIMLQQTQVTTARPYFDRFLSVFPTVFDLAKADLDKVLKLWQGLGYYARARHLHQAAQKIVAQFSGKIPATLEGLCDLPGIGRSTAGAILTIAFGQRYPILDGNVRRVLCRFFAIEEDPREKAVEAWLWTCSEKLMPRRHESGDYLQAIMDLGATVCTPKRPNCGDCPVGPHCSARQLGLQQELPCKIPRKTIPHYDYFAGLLSCEDSVLIHQRPLTGLLAGLWEFPGSRLEGELKEGTMLSCFESFFQKEINQTIKHARLCMSIRHVFTHFKMTLHVFSAEIKTPVPVKIPLKWVKRPALSDYAFSAAHQKIISRLPDLDNRPSLF